MKSLLIPTSIVFFFTTDYNNEKKQKKTNWNNNKAMNYDHLVDYFLGEM